MIGVLNAIALLGFALASLGYSIKLDRDLDREFPETGDDGIYPKFSDNWPWDCDTIQFPFNPSAKQGGRA